MSGPRAADPKAGRRRTLKRRARKALARALVWVAVRTIPYLYMAYCWFVWRTSRIEWEMGPLEEAARRHGKFVALLWHQEVFTVAYGYRSFGGHTLASVSDAGQVIARMLELCNFTVFRGGSSSANTRKTRVLPTMIRHMKKTPQVLYGITVDGSLGPPFRLKPGGVLIAKSCGAPLFVARTSCQRRLELPTWDRTAIPLPFNRIQLRAVGPYWIDPAADGDEVTATCEHLERELLDLCAWVNAQVEGGAPQPSRGYPEGWTPRWRPGQLGLRRRDHDLRPEAPPAFASPPVPAS